MSPLRGQNAWTVYHLAVHLPEQKTHQESREMPVTSQAQHGDRHLTSLLKLSQLSAVGKELLYCEVPLSISYFIGETRNGLQECDSTIP